MGGRRQTEAKLMQNFGWKLVRGVFIAVVVLGLCFLVLPLLVIIPLSFNAEPYFTFTEGMLRLEGEAYSLRWYRSIVENPEWGKAIVNSFIIGVFATIVATVLGTLAALGLNHPRLPFRQAISALLISPMVTPVIIVAVGVFFFYSTMGLAQTHLGLILAHAMLGAPFVVITVTATLAGFDQTLMRAATSLGAGPLTAFMRIQLPLISPGVLTGALFAFIASFDEVVVVLFLGGVDQRTIPRQMWSGIREEISPTILAIATLLIVFAILLLLAVELLQRRSKLEAKATNE